MKAAKIKKVKDKKEVEVEESYSLKSMIKIVLILLVIFTAFYFITTLFVHPTKEEIEEVEPDIDSTTIMVSELLNRTEDEYYVLAKMTSKYSSGVSNSANYSGLYNSYIKDYTSKDNSLKFYYIDLDDAFNKKYISDTLNITDDVNKIKLNDEVLFKVKDSKIEKYYVGNKDIIKKLSELKES